MSIPTELTTTGHKLYYFYGYAIWPKHRSYNDGESSCGVVYCRRPRKLAAGFKFHCRQRSEKRRHWRYAVKKGQGCVAVTTVGPHAGEGGNTVTRRELLSFVITMRHHKYFHGQKFHIRVDKFTMTYLDSFKNLEDWPASWVYSLEDHNFTYECCSEPKDINTGMLSIRCCPWACTHCPTYND
jgi:hypothetical protein